MSHRPEFDASYVVNNNSLTRKSSNRGIVTMSSPNGLKRVKSGRGRSSTMSHRSNDSNVNYAVPSNDACNQYYDKNLGRAYDKFK